MNTDIVCSGTFQWWTLRGRGGGAVAPMPKFQKALNDIKCVMKLYESIKAIMVGYVLSYILHGIKGKNKCPLRTGTFVYYTSVYAILQYGKNGFQALTQIVVLRLNTDTYGTEVKI